MKPRLRNQPNGKKSIRAKNNTAKLKTEHIKKVFTIILRVLENEGPIVEEEVERDCESMEKTCQREEGERSSRKKTKS